MSTIGSAFWRLNHLRSAAERACHHRRTARRLLPQLASQLQRTDSRHRCPRRRCPRRSDHSAPSFTRRLTSIRGTGGVAGWIRLYRRTWNAAVRAKDAAIAGAWPQNLSAVRAFVKELTRVDGHFFLSLSAALRTADRRSKLYRFLHDYRVFSRALACAAKTSGSSIRSGITPPSWCIQKAGLGGRSPVHLAERS